MCRLDFKNFTWRHGEQIDSYSVAGSGQSPGNLDNYELGAKEIRETRARSIAVNNQPRA